MHDVCFDVFTRSAALTGARAANPTTGWTTSPIGVCGGHFNGSGANGLICVFADSSFVENDGSGNFVDSTSGAYSINNFSGYVYNNGGSLDNSMSSYISGVNATVVWYATANDGGALLLEQPLGYRENLVQDGFNDVASAIVIR